MLEDTDTSITPVRRALAVYGLIGDDADVLSIYGTSMMVNEENETLIRNILSEAYSWQCRTAYDAEELDRSLEGWLYRLATCQHLAASF